MSTWKHAERAPSKLAKDQPKKKRAKKTVTRTPSRAERRKIHFSIPKKDRPDWVGPFKSDSKGMARRTRRGVAWMLAHGIKNYSVTADGSVVKHHDLPCVSPAPQWRRPK